MISGGLGTPAVSMVFAASAKTGLEFALSSAVPTPRQSEEYVLAKYGGEEQVSYLTGEEVSQFTAGATRPDVVIRKSNGTIAAIEVKNYNLESQASRNELYRELERQITSRVENLPKGSTQRIVLDTRNRKFSKETVSTVVYQIKLRLSDVYPNIPIDVL